MNLKKKKNIISMNLWTIKLHILNGGILLCVNFITNYNQKKAQDKILRQYENDKCIYNIYKAINRATELFNVF